MKNQYYWFEFPGHTYLPNDHDKFPEYMAKYLNNDKDAMKWKYVTAVNPPEHYGLTLLTE